MTVAASLELARAGVYGCIVLLLLMVLVTWFTNSQRFFFRFRPLANSSPAIGSLNKLEEVDEVRIETVVQKQFLTEAVRAAKKAHPYEEPAIHITEIIDYKLYLGNDDCTSTSSALSRFGPISVVLEGLDGVGKSTVAEKLAAVLNAEHMMTPPAIMRTGREWFVKQDNHMRKAYYMVRTVNYYSRFANSLV